MKPAARRTAEGILFTGQYQLTMGQVYFRACLAAVQFRYLLLGTRSRYQI